MSKTKTGFSRALRRFDRGILRGFHRFFWLAYTLKPLRPLLRPTYRFVHGHYRLTAGVLTLLMLASVVVPVLQYRHTVNKYELNSQAKALLGTADKDLTKKLTFDSQQQLYEFNKEAKHQRTPDQNPVTGLKSQIGGSGADDEQLYSMDAPRDLSKGITYYDNQRDLSFKIIPQFATLPAEVREGHLIYPLAGSSGQVAYTVTSTGLKQNVVLYESPGDALSMNYKLDLPKSLEARMIEETGEVGIYSADPEVLAAIDYQASDAAVRLEDARNNADKTHLTFKIPAPVVMMQGKIDQATIGNIKSHFLLNDDILTVMTTGLDKAEYPLAIDPTVSIDSASEFGMGTAEDNNQTIGGGDVTRGGLTGGALGTWTSLGSYGNARQGTRLVAYNDYMYVVGGWGASGAQATYWAPINSNGTLGTWADEWGMPNRAEGNAAVAYNGFIYVAGGQTGLTFYDDVRYAPLIESDGSIGDWDTTTPLPTALKDPGLVAYKGYMYLFGGWDGVDDLASVYMAPIKSDGTLGTWVQLSDFGPSGAYTSNAFAYNDYMYVVGGNNSNPYVAYAPINPDGTLGTWATTSSYSTDRSVASVFAYNGYVYITGGTTNFSTARNDVQYAPINANGSLGAWSTTSTLSQARYFHGGTAYNGYVYVAGGASGGVPISNVEYARVSMPGRTGSTYTNPTGFTNGRYGFGSVTYNGYMYVLGGVGQQNDVRYAPINANGSIGTWNSTTALNTGTGATGRTYHKAVAYNGYMYVLGGDNPSSPSNTVFYNTINSNGTLGGSWTSTSSFSNARDSQGAFAYNGYMYIVGGWSGSGSTCYNDVQYAPINSNGSLGAWNSAGTGFTTGRSMPGVHAYNGYLYVFGGSPTDSTSNNLSDVQYAPINSDGTIGSWSTSSNPLPAGRSAFGSTVHNGVIYIAGGTTGSNVRMNDVLYAPISAGGDIGPWTSGTSFTTQRSFNQALSNNGYLYVLGGVNNSSTAINDIRATTLENGGPGTTGSWTSTSSFSGTRYGHGSVAYNGYMYILGGYNGSAYNDVQYAPINRTNGTLGSWSSAGPDFTTARYGLDVFVYNGYIYVLGGTTNGSVYLNDVQYAAINTDGTIGSWQTTTSFPTARYGHHVVAYDGYIYLTGGNSGSARNDVQYAAINTDGTIGSWSSGGTFTNARYGHDATINNGYIYIMGGNNSGTYYSDVQVAQIQGGGSLGSWTTLTPFANPRYGIDSFVYNGYLYVVGGYNGVSYYNDVQYAPIAPNGHIGQWQRTTDFTTARYVHTALAHNGYMYILGGNGGSYLNNVYYAPMNIMPRKATYSKVLDFGSQSKITGISYTGNLVDGLRNIRYRFANSAGTFPTTAPRGADLPFTCDAGSHVQILATIDNTTSSVFPDSAGELGQINSITVTYDIPGVPTDKRLRHGAYFSSEELQPFDTRGCG